MAQIVKNELDEITIEVKVKLTGSLFEMENAIQDACNEVGNLATDKALKIFDIDGSPI